MLGWLYIATSLLASVGGVFGLCLQAVVHQSSASTWLYTLFVGLAVGNKSLDLN